MASTNDDSEESKEDGAPPKAQAQLGRELFVFTAQKAGMTDVDRARVQQVVLDMSKDSQFFRNSMRQNAKVDAKIADMRAQLAALSGARREVLRRRVDSAVAQLEAARDLTRTVVVVDMDMFYAAVEMRDDPALRDVPLAVGGMSMISTTNYIARKFGVRAAMPGFIGKELCPALVFVRPNFQKYTAVATQIRAIFAEYDPHFSAFSLDEAKLDITEYMEENWSRYHTSSGAAGATRNGLGGEQVSEEEKDVNSDDEDEQGAREAASRYRSDDDRVQVAGAVVAEIRHKIFLKTQLTASAGVAANSMLAKIASDMNKPNGQFVLPFTRASVVSFIQRQPVRKIGGIGKVMEKILAAIGVATGADLFSRRVELFHLFSDKTAPWLLRTSLGIQETREATVRKSFSRERTFQNLSDPPALEQMCLKVCGYLAEDLQKAGAGCHTLTLKLKCADFSVRSRSVSFASTLRTKDDLYSNAVAILRKELPLTLRLLGVRASALVSLSGAAHILGGANMSSSSKQRQLGMDRFATASAKSFEAGENDAVSDGDAEQYDSGEVSAEDDESGLAGAHAGGSSDAVITAAVPSLPGTRKSKRKREGASIADFVTTITKDATPDIVAAMLETNAAGSGQQSASSEHARDDTSARLESLGDDVHFDESSFQPCPICGKMINVSNAIAINSHVDACITKRSQRAVASRSSALTATTGNTKSSKRDVRGALLSRLRNYFPDAVLAPSFQPCPICGEMLNASSRKLVNTHIDACVLTPLSQPTPESPPGEGAPDPVASAGTGSEVEAQSDQFAAAATTTTTTNSELDSSSNNAHSDSRCPICGVGIDASDSVAVNAHVDACVAKQAREENRASASRFQAGGRFRNSKKYKRAGSSGRGQHQHSIQSFFGGAAREGGS